MPSPSAAWECAFCTRQFNSDEEHRDFDGDMLCVHCYEEDTVTCDDCGDRIVGEDSMWWQPTNETFCESCLDNFTFICSECGDREHNDDEQILEGYEGSYCYNCISNISTVCEDCDDRVHDDESHYIEDRGVSICQSCLENGDYANCDRCGNLVSDPTYVEGEPWCDGCMLSSSIGECAECSEITVVRWFEGGENDVGITFEDVHLCMGCADEDEFVRGWDDGLSLMQARAHILNRNEVRRRQESGWSDDVHRCWMCRNNTNYWLPDPRHEGQHICTSCVTRDSRSAVGFRYNVLGYTFKPAPLFNHVKEGSNQLYFGTESEINIDTNHTQLALRIMAEQDTNKMFYAKRDSSVSGIEVVSHPFTFDWMKENEDKFDVLFEVSKLGMAHHVSCGMHVHMSAAAFRPIHRAKFFDLFFNNRRLMYSLSRRTPRSWRDWVDRQKFDQRFNKYTVAKGERNQDRSSMLHFTRGNTIECRMFRGTGTKPGYFGNIELLQAAYMYTKDEGIRDVSEGRFIEYTRDHGRLFKNFLSLYDNNIFRQVAEE